MSVKIITQNLQTILLLVLVSVPVSSTNQTESAYSFQNTEIEIDMTPYSKTVFSDWTPSDFESFRRNIVLRDQLVKEYILEDMFPHVPPSTCDDEQCQTYLYDVTNHNLGEQHVKSQPTLLLVGGIHGSETIGTQALARFVLLLQKLYQQSSEIFQMLNNTRLLVIPMINANGFYRKSDFEAVSQTSKQKQVDPNFDFNINPKEHCFVSSTAQFLQSLHSEYLVFGSLVFSRGDFKVAYPKVHKSLGVSDVSQEEVFYRTLAQSLSSVFNEANEVSPQNLFEDQENELPSLELFTNMLFERDYGQTRSGAYIEWAAGASQEASSVKLDCLPPKSSLDPSLIKPSEYSNRAVAVEVQLDKAKLQTLKDPFGNEVACVDKDHPDADYGIIASVINLSKKFVQSLVPFVSLHSVKVTTTTDHTPTQSLDFVFQLYGSYWTTFAKLEHEHIDSQSSKISSREKEKVNFKQLQLNVTFRDSHTLKEDKLYDLHFNLDLERQYMRRIEKNSTVSSHYLKVLMSPQYLNTLKKFSLRYFDSRKFILMDFRIDRLGKSLIFEQFNSFSRFFQERRLLVQTGPYFPFALEYRPETGSVDYSRISKKVSSRSVLETDDYTYQTGVVNRLLDGLKSREFLNKYNSLSDNQKILVYDDQTPLFCRAIQTDVFLGILESKRNTKGLEPSSTQDDTQSQKTNDYESISDMCLEYTNNTSPDQNENEKGLFLDLDQIVQMIPSVFVNLVGHKVFLASKNSVSKKPQLLKGDAQDTSLIGTIVIPDLRITGPSHPDSRFELPAPDAVQQMPHQNYLPFPKHKVTCGTFSPSFPITTAYLKEAAVKQFRSKRASQDFFFVQIQDMLEQPGSVQISVLSNAKNPSNQYTLRNKDQAFALLRTRYNDVLVVEEEENKNKLKIYRGSFPRKDVRLEGLYVMLHEGGSSEPVFDCFLGASFRSTSMDAVNSFKIYLSLLREIDLQIEEEFGEDVLHPNRKPRRWTFLVILALLLLLVAGGLGLYYYFFVFLRVKRVEATNRRNVVILED